MAEINRRQRPDYVSDWLSDPRPTCPVCGLPRDDVTVRSDPYLECVYGDSSAEHENHPFTMVSCEACWWDRYAET